MDKQIGDVNRRMTEIQVNTQELVNDSQKKVPPTMHSEALSHTAETTSLNDRKAS